MPPFKANKIADYEPVLLKKTETTKPANIFTFS